MNAPDPSHPVLVHFYRAVVSHMDVWRQRMDATTNWAAASTAGIVTFTFSAVSAPHFVLLLAFAFDCVFLLMEARRYQTFDLWRRRFRLLNQHLIAPVLHGGVDGDGAERREALQRVAIDLGRMVPHLPLAHAVGYRVRRNYGYLFLVTAFAWALKLEVHPTPADELGELVSRAAVGILPGAAVVAAFGMAIGAFALLALRAPSEGMMNWAEIPSPLQRWVSTSQRWGRGVVRRRPEGDDRT